jgi:hypothetical protein
MRRHRWAAPLLALVAAASAGLIGSPASAAPPYTPEERAVAIASPSLVFLDVRLAGYLRIKATGALVEPSIVYVHSRCSGFVVSGDGHVVTTTHCLQPTADSQRGSAVSIVATDLVKANKLSAADKANFVTARAKDSVFTGVTANVSPVSTLTGQLFAATTNAAAAASFTGRVVDSQPTSGDDLTLIQLDTSGLPVAKLTATPLNPDLSVVSIGFGSAPGSTFTPVSRPSTVLGRYGAASPLRYRLDGDLGSASSGGMVVDNDGQVVGMITADLHSTDHTNRLVAGTAQILSLLSNAGVHNDLSATDTTYRAGLDAYFGGRYREAITSLDAVLAAEPDNILARTYRQHASERLAIEGEPITGPTIWKIAAAAAAAGVLLGLIPVGVLALRRWRRRSAVAGEPPPATTAVRAGVSENGAPAVDAPTPPKSPPTAWQGWAAPLPPPEPRAGSSVPRRPVMPPSTPTTPPHEKS